MSKTKEHHIDIVFQAAGELNVGFTEKVGVYAGKRIARITPAVYENKLDVWMVEQQPQRFAAALN